MDVDVTARRLRCFLLIFNTVIGHAGALLLAIGLWLRFDKTIDSYFRHSATTPFYAALDLPAAVRTAYAIFIAFGAYIYFLAYCGCCIIVKQPRTLLGFNIAVIITLMAGELGGGIYARVKLRDIVENIEAEFVNDFQANYKSQSSLLNDALMNEFKCCGWNGYQDFSFTSPMLPYPCCMNSSVNQFANSSCSVSMVPDVYEGFGSLIADVLAHAGKIFLGVGIGLALLETIVLAGAIFLCCSIKQ